MSTVPIDPWVPKYIYEQTERPPGYTVTAAEWSKLFTLILEQGNYNTDTLVTLIPLMITTENGYTKEEVYSKEETYSKEEVYSKPETYTQEEVLIEINNRIIDIGASDMQQSVYDPQHLRTDIFTFAVDEAQQASTISENNTKAWATEKFITPSGVDTKISDALVDYVTQTAFNAGVANFYTKNTALPGVSTGTYRPRNIITTRSVPSSISNWPAGSQDGDIMLVY